MSLIGSISLTIGFAIVKHLTAGLLGDSVQSQVAQDLLDFAHAQVDGATEAPGEQPQIEQIAEQVMRKLGPLFAQEAQALDANARTALIQAVAQTLMDSNIDADLLVDQRLDPAQVAARLASKQPKLTVGFTDDEKTLYRRLLMESCRQLVAIAHQFVGYRTLVDRRLLVRQEELLTNLTRLLAEPEEQARRYEKLYCEALCRKLDKFERIGIDYAESATHRQSLERAYVSLRVTLSDGLASAQLTEALDGPRQRQARSIVPTGSIEEILTLAPRLVIQGQPGSGKSTLLRWLALQAAKHHSAKDELAWSGWEACVPFYIQLRSFVGKPLPNPREWPALQVEMAALEPPSAWVDDLLNAGRALVLIDGVDELPEKQRAAMLERLQDLIAAYPFARYIITSRPAAIKIWPEWLVWSREAGFLSAVMQEMELDQIFNFVQRWHDALKNSITDPAQRAASQALAESLKQLLRQRLPLRQLARNPLLCTMICALHREHPRNMPHNRIKLYQDCVELLMYKRDIEREVRSLDDYPALSHVHEEVVLREYAYHLMLNGESEEDLADADAYFTERLQVMNMPGWTSERLRDYFVARTGLLIEPGEGRIAFAHRTFQEFLAARMIAKKNEIKMLLDKARDDQWRETILLTIGVPEISQKQSERLFTGLLKKADNLTTLRNRQELYLLAVACLETAIYLTPALRKQVLTKAATLIPPRDDDAIALLAKGGDAMVELLQLNAHHSFAKMARCVAGLAALGSESAMATIAQYAVSTQYSDKVASVLRRAIGAGLLAFDPVQYCQRILRYVQILDLMDTQVSNAGLTHLQGLPNLQSLSLNYTQVSDAGLAHLQGLPNLQSLNLSNTQVSNAGLVHLQSLPNLQSLNLSKTQVSDVGLVHLQSLPNLQSLNLMETQVSDAGLAHLRSLTHLQLLSLNYTQVNDAGLVHLRSLTHLQSLNLCRTQVSDAGLACLQGLTHLQKLYLYNTQVSDAGLAHLQRFLNLQSLNLNHTKVSDAGLACLHELPNLQWLALNATQVSDAGLAQLHGLPNLQSLDLWQTQVSDAGLAQLRGLPNLKLLFLMSTQVSDAGLAHLEGLPNLQSLNLTDTQVSDAGLTYLRDLPNLQSLNLTRTQVSNAGLVHLQGLSSLQVLNLRGTQVSDAGLVHLQGLSSLQSLDLRGTQVSDTTILDHLLGLDIFL